MTERPFERRTKSGKKRKRKKRGASMQKTNTYPAQTRISKAAFKK